MADELTHPTPCAGSDGTPHRLSNILDAWLIAATSRAVARQQGHYQRALKLRTSMSCHLVECSCRHADAVRRFNVGRRSACSQVPPRQRPTALEHGGGGEDVERARAGAGGVGHSGGATPDGQGHLRDLGKLAVQCGLTLGIMALTEPAYLA